MKSRNRISMVIKVVSIASLFFCLIATEVNSNDNTLIDLQSRKVEVRRAAAEKAAQMVFHDFEKVLPLLVNALKDSDAEVRYYISVSLTAQGLSSEKSAKTLKSAVPALIEALRDQDTRIRAQAALAIGAVMPYPPQDAAGSLVVLLRDPSVDVKKSAIVSISRIRPATVEYLNAVLDSVKHSQNHELTEAAELALSEFITADSSLLIPGLLVRLAQEKSILRLTIIRALGLSGKKAKEAVSVLRTIAHDPNEPREIRQNARTAIRQIQGREDA